MLGLVLILVVGYSYPSTFRVRTKHPRDWLDLTLIPYHIYALKEC
jgi:hypothetical protein